MFTDNPLVQMDFVTPNESVLAWKSIFQGLIDTDSKFPKMTSFTKLILYLICTLMCICHKG